MSTLPAASFHKPSRSMPEWALLERRVLDTLSHAPDMLADYLTPDGEILWPECVPNFQTFAYSNVDNAFEGFQNFPLLYLLGGDDSILDYAQREFDALSRQFSAKKKENLGIPEEEAARLGRNTMLVDGCFPDLDWMHTGEAALFLYHLLLANPAHAANRERILRFAQYQFGENPAGFERNYDPVHKVFKSGYFGSNGPAWQKFGHPIRHRHWMDFYGLAFYDVPGVRTYLDLDDPEKAALYGKVYGERLKHCDTVTNLLSTSLAACAYGLTGDAQYKDFITEYVGGWRERAKAYPVMPDNAGPSGQVGETLGGRFYGSHYGWTHPHGYYFIEDAMIVGGENERLVTGRTDAVDWAKGLYDYLIGHYGIPREGGGVLFPQKHADPDSFIEFIGRPDAPMTAPAETAPDMRRYLQTDGWYEYGAPEASHWGHICAASRSMADVRRMEEILPPGKLTVSMSNVAKKYKGGQHASFVRYLAGEYPEYPEAILRHTLDVFYNQNVILDEEKSGASAGFGYAPDGEGEWDMLRSITAELREKYGLGFDESVVHSYYQTFLLYRQPISTEGLLHLTMGAMSPVYNGGLISAEVRWFDMDRRRPGLCEGCAALIERIDADGCTVTLANTDTKPHTLCMQGGAYGEHEILRVEGEGQTLAPCGKWASLTLSPGTVVTLRVSLRRWAYAPSFEEPFGAYDRLEK